MNSTSTSFINGSTVSFRRCCYFGISVPHPSAAAPFLSSGYPPPGCEGWRFHRRSESFLWCTRTTRSTILHRVNLCIPFFDLLQKKKPGPRFVVHGLWVQDLRPLTSSNCSIDFYMLSILAQLFSSINGTIIRRLHFRHLSSTPPGTKRANMLPHIQRKGFIPRWSWLDLSWPCCFTIASFISSGFLVFSGHPDRSRHKCQKHHNLRRQRFQRGIDA